jgi:hypothetical protein
LQRCRRARFEILENRLVLSPTVAAVPNPANSALSGYVYLGSGAWSSSSQGISGVTVRLLDANSDEVTAVSPIQTGSDGYYKFSGLAAGTYEIQETPDPDYVDGVATAGSLGGTVSTDEIQVQVGSATNGTGYNFSATSVLPSMFSAVFFYASSPSYTQIVQGMHTAPTVDLSGGAAGEVSPSFQTGDSPVAIASTASITSPDSPTLVSMTVTITNPLDGASEKLAADTSGTSITSTASGNTLMLSGCADTATYLSVLQGITYSDDATPAQDGNRTITVQVNDGTKTSLLATVTVAVGAQNVALPSVTGISPTTGPAAGGTAVTISGLNLSNATAVDFGTLAATSFTVDSATQITAVSPAGTGTVDVTVDNAGGASLTSSADQFTYAAAPAVTAISPTAGPLAGGTPVIITGAGLTGAAAVDFGTVPASSFTVNSDTQITATSPLATGAGAVDVTEVTPGGSSAASPADQFSYVVAPAVSGISPTEGSAGTSVTITGTGFTGATAVDFGTVAASNFTVNSDTQVTAVSPAGSGTVDVMVTTAGGTSATSPADQFAYVAVTGISPTAGPLAGGTSVTITGTNLDGATAVNFGALPATQFTVDSATQITATSPAGIGTGAVDVTVDTPNGASATSAADQFSYLAAPAVSGISPTEGPLAGGASVAITGTGFTDASAVDFGTVPATHFTVNSDTQITATSPAGTGAADVTVVTPGGTSATSPADLFSYVAAPTVTGISPSAGSALGGLPVTITGTGFTDATGVNFGAVAATSFTVDSDTEISVATPVGTGTVDVTVVAPGGTSAISPADLFAYVAVTGISSTAGPLAGGTTVTITGTNLDGATVVDFGTQPATSFTVDSPTQITAVSPAGTGVGAVDVTVDTPNGMSATSPADLFTYVAAPAVTKISPAAGPAAGGTTVTITGTGFTGATAVDFGTLPATAFTVNSDAQITATSPAGTGSVDVTVATVGGTSATSAADLFGYVAVTGISPTAGPLAGGATVTITGTNLAGATNVYFGAAAATTFTVNSPTQITATSPAGTGTVNITVVTPAGTSATSSADEFTYTAAPAVSFIDPTEGPLAGGASVLISGANLSNATAVYFGNVAATNFEVNSRTTLTATSPPGTGTVDVTVVTPGGTSATSSADLFTYVVAPTVSGISPTEGPVQGGTPVIITGTGFTGATTVEFGTAATAFTFNSPTQITANSPYIAGTGTVDVTVITPGGQSATSPADLFTYSNTPDIVDSVMSQTQDWLAS